ncbi:hypothetical protein P7K49_013060 [Saguinus oedipus]|uniref:Uncharacterized protein n=1 Tax=Saguinus oedipus TaxID=9490 RepID=A0ABQ9VFP4_SAGOE|nr:hypothetical protein P7K49_013060 [Saguinus oedipus]
MAKHHKTYSREEEYHQRLQTFASNWRKINAHNNGNHTFKMAVNQFSDMSFAEIKHKYLWSEPQNCSATKSNYLRGTGPYPPSMDWRKKGHFVSPVKNQGTVGLASEHGLTRPTPSFHQLERDVKEETGGGQHEPGDCGQNETRGGKVREGSTNGTLGPPSAGNSGEKRSQLKIEQEEGQKTAEWGGDQGACGSCWTFSTTGALESAIAIATGKMLSLAEQQLVDCAQDFNNHGCQGYVPDQEGPKTSPHFPLIASTGSRYTPTTVPGGEVASHGLVSAGTGQGWNPSPGLCPLSTISPGSHSTARSASPATKASESVANGINRGSSTITRHHPNLKSTLRGRVDLSMNSLKFKPPQLVTPCEREATVDQGWSSPGPAFPAHSKQAARTNDRIYHTGSTYRVRESCLGSTCPGSMAMAMTVPWLMLLTVVWGCALLTGRLALRGLCPTEAHLDCSLNSGLSETPSATGTCPTKTPACQGRHLARAGSRLYQNNRRGLPSQAFEYILYNKGIMGEDTYPYQGKDPSLLHHPTFPAPLPPAMSTIL